MSSSVKTNSFLLDVLTSFTSNFVPVISSPLFASVNRIFKSFSTDTKLTLTLLPATPLSDMLSETLSTSSKKFPKSAASVMEDSPSPPTIPIPASSVPTGAIACICSLTRLFAKNIPKITTTATKRTTPVVTRTASRAVMFDARFFK